MIPARRTGHMIAQDTGQTEVLFKVRDEVKVSKNAKKDVVNNGFTIRPLYLFPGGTNEGNLNLAR